MTMIDNLTSNLPEWMPNESDSNNYKFLNSFADSLTSLSNTYANLRTQLQIDTATGNDLDKIGLLFQLKRVTGESDTTYRNRILNYWNSGRGGGTLPVITALLSQFSLDDFTITEVPPCKLKIQIYTDGIFTQTATLEYVISKGKAAGIYIIWEWYLEKGSFLTETLTIDEVFSMYNLSEGRYLAISKNRIGPSVIS